MSVEQIPNAHFDDFGSYMAAQMGAFAAMSEHERAQLYAWERKNVNGSTVSTADWPGWVKYIGHPPWHRSDRKPAKRQVSVKLRMQVYDLDGHACRRCGATENLSVDHIVSESKGGPTKLHNLQTLCRSCNSRKGTK